MEILDKNIPSIPSIPTEWAHGAMAKASQVLEPITEPIMHSSLMSHMGRRRSTMGRIGDAVRAHPFAVGATVLIIGGIAVMALRDAGRPHPSADTEVGDDERRVRSVA